MDSLDSFGCKVLILGLAVLSIIFFAYALFGCATTSSAIEITPKVVESTPAHSMFWINNHGALAAGCEPYFLCACEPIRGGTRGEKDRAYTNTKLNLTQHVFERVNRLADAEFREVWGVSSDVRYVCGVFYLAGVTSTPN